MLHQHKGTFAYDLADLPGYSGSVGPFTIPLVHDNSIVSKRRLKSPQDVAIINEKCHPMEAANIIIPAPAYTQYASEVTMPAKKDPSGAITYTRFCIDYIPLNAASVTDHYGMHTPNDLFQRIAGATFFTKVDMRAGYHQIPVHPNDISKTSFWWLNRLYACARMPFGAKSASAHFQRCMDIEIVTWRIAARRSLTTA